MNVMYYYVFWHWKSLEEDYISTSKLHFTEIYVYNIFCKISIHFQRLAKVRKVVLEPSKLIFDEKVRLITYLVIFMNVMFHAFLVLEKVREKLF